MDHHPHQSTLASRAEAERLLGIAEKLLRNKDLTSSKDFAILAQETEPLLEGSDQILAIIDVLIAADRRMNNQHDWYSILQVAPRTEDFELIKKQYRRLALLLHPDKNKYPFADSAFHLVADAWAILSDPGKKSSLDNELTLFTKVDLVPNRTSKEATAQRQANKPRQGSFSGNKSGGKLPVRRGARGESGGYDGNVDGDGDGASGAKRSNPSGGFGGLRSANFWTACPYCYNLYEYPRVYEGCCLKCQNCSKAFTAVAVMAMPPTVPGKEEYYCCWGVFPMGFSENGQASGGFANWAPPMQSAGGVANGGGKGQGGANVNSNANVRPPPPPPPAAIPAVAAPVGTNSGQPVKRGRGRPRKNV